MVRIPDYGRCRCGGKIIKHWGGVCPEYYCDSCGVVLDHPGIRNECSIGDYELIIALGETWNMLNKEEVELIPFIEAVSYVLGKRPTIRISDLIKNGYSVYGNIVRRRDK